MSLNEVQYPNSINEPFQIQWKTNPNPITESLSLSLSPHSLFSRTGPKFKSHLWDPIWNPTLHLGPKWVSKTRFHKPDSYKPSTIPDPISTLKYGSSFANPLHCGLRHRPETPNVVCFPNTLNFSIWSINWLLFLNLLLSLLVTFLIIYNFVNHIII